MMGCERSGLDEIGIRGRVCSLLSRSGLEPARRRPCHCLHRMSGMLQSQAVKDAAHTGQGEQLVTNKDG